MNDLTGVTKEPTFLGKLDFIIREEDSTDTRRMVRYERTFQNADSQVKFIIQVEFEMWLRDDPSTSYDDNVSYKFNHVYLKVVDRSMEEYDDNTCGRFGHGLPVYDEESAKPRTVGRYLLGIQKVSQLRTLCKLLIAK